MRMNGRILLTLLAGAAAGCGTQPGALVVNDLTGSFDVLVDGSVNPDINLNVDANVQADVNCTINCDLNTGECDTICTLADGTPATPEEIGAAIYAANCVACHGDPPGTGFAPDIRGKSAAEILEMFNSGSHPGGTFPDLSQEDVDNLAAFLASV